jgi:hypothetical protein
VICRSDFLLLLSSEKKKGKSKFFPFPEFLGSGGVQSKAFFEVVAIRTFTTFYLPLRVALSRRFVNLTP